MKRKDFKSASAIKGRSREMRGSVNNTDVYVPKRGGASPLEEEKVSERGGTSN